MLGYLNVLLVLVVVVLLNTSAEKIAKQQVWSYQSCSRDADCKENAFCYGNDDNVMGKCKCLKGYELIRNETYYECIQGIPWGEKCTKDIECEISTGENAFCDQQICHCKENFHYFEGRCYKGVLLNETCMTDFNCYVEDETETGGHGACKFGKCICPKGKTPSKDFKRCISARKLGEKCFSDEECVTPNSKCLTICDCGVNYVLDRNETSCIKAAEQFGENCTSDAQCSKLLTGSQCFNNKCGCSPSFHEYGNRCEETKKTGEHCESDAQCWYNRQLVNNTKCDNSLCKCQFGLQTDGSCKIQIQNDNSSGSKLVCIYFAITLLNIFIVKCIF